MRPVMSARTRCAWDFEIANTAASSRTVRLVRRPTHARRTRARTESAQGRPRRPGPGRSRRTMASSAAAESPLALTSIIALVNFIAMM